THPAGRARRRTQGVGVGRKRWRGRKCAACCARVCRMYHRVHRECDVRLASVVRSTMREPCVACSRGADAVYITSEKTTYKRRRKRAKPAPLLASRVFQRSLHNACYRTLYMRNKCSIFRAWVLCRREFVTRVLRETVESAGAFRQAIGRPSGLNPPS